MEPHVRIKELEEKVRLLESQNILLKKENRAVKLQQPNQYVNSNKLFQDLFLNTRQACIIFSAIDKGNDFIISDVNPAFERIEGVKKELVLGIKLSDSYQYTSANIMDVYRRVYKSGKSEKFVFLGEDKDKQQQWRDNDIFKLASGEVVTVYDDVTLLKEKEADLLNSEARYKALADAASEAVFIIENEKCIDLNQKALEIYGYSYEEAIGIPVLDLIAPKNKELVREKLAMEYAEPYEGWCIRKNGEIFPAELRGKNFDYVGRKVRITTIRDISDQKQAEMKLVKSEAKFRAFFENNTAAMLQINPKSKQIVEANAAAINFYGYSLEQFKKLKIYDINILAPAEIDQKMKEAMALPTQTLICKHRLFSGESREVEVYMSPVITNDDHQLFITIYNVSEREDNKRALEESERKLNNAQSIAKTGSWEYCFDSEKLKWSEQTANIYETPKEFLYTIENYNRLIHPEDLNKVMELWKKSIVEKTEYFSIHRILTPSDKIKYVEEKGYTVYDKKGKPIRFFGTIQDVTEQKIAEIEFQKSQNYLKEAQRIAKVGHFEFNLSNRKTDWSDEVSRILGFDIENTNLSLEKYRKQLHVEDVDAQYAIFSQALKEKKDYTAYYRITSLTGEEKHIEEKGHFEFDKEGKPIKAIGTIQDITSSFLVKKALEESKAQLAIINQDLEKRVKESLKKSRDKDHLLIQQSRSAVLGEMIGNIAHQWRQPLTEVSLLINDLEDAYTFGVLNKAYFEKTTEIVYRRLKYMSDTINDFSKMYTDDFKKESFSPKELIEKLMQFTEGTIKKNKIQIRFMCKEDFEVFGYPNMLSHIILNLLNNSRDILIERSIKRPKIWIKLEKSESHFYIRVLDNGKGIDKDVIHKIFDPYFTTKDKKRGSGLGLYMTKSMVEKQMNGQIQVQNQRDGAEFKITLNLKNENL